PTLLGIGATLIGADPIRSSGPSRSRPRRVSCGSLATPCKDGRMRGSTRGQVWLTAALTVVVFAGMAEYAVYAGISAGSIVSQLLVSGVFAATGLAAWARRPPNRLGPLMVAFAWTFMAIVFTQPVVPVPVPLRGSALGAPGPR